MVGVCTFVGVLVAAQVRAATKGDVGVYHANILAALCGASSIMILRGLMLL